ncbi:hypothetical protein ANN_00675 [Periplaneta americana]|uniref:Uncharacterized protein n=1 Tax=Periplaneta americana TaxID=6978 RepID=A0ABQ8TRJ4_PERAM|nr:hypothetical protein ANN_00675 [Periplaneta americana]
MSPGSCTESYLAFAHIGLRENPGPPGFAARRADRYSTARSVLDKKRTCVKRVLTEEMLDETDHQIEKSPTTSSYRVAQQGCFRSLITNLNDVRSHTTAELWREVTDQ